MFDILELNEILDNDVYLLKLNEEIKNCKSKKERDELKKHIALRKIDLRNNYTFKVPISGIYKGILFKGKPV